jgi:hypothetical protein
MRGGYKRQGKMMKFGDAYKLVKDKRSVVKPNKGFQEQLIKYEA